MDSVNYKLFNAIANFVEALVEVFGPRSKGLQLYNRLISKTSIRDAQPVEKHIETFKKFLQGNVQYILAKNLRAIPRETMIAYSPRVSFDIQQIIHFATDEELRSIEQHLLNIHLIMNPKDTKAVETLVANNENNANGSANTDDTRPSRRARAPPPKKVSTSSGKEEEDDDDFMKQQQAAGLNADLLQKLKLNSNTKEGALINNLLTKTVNSVKGAKDMPSALMGLISSGLITDMQKDFGDAIGGGEQGINPKKLIKEISGMVTNLLGEMADGDEEGAKPEGDGTKQQGESAAPISSELPQDLQQPVASQQAVQQKMEQLVNAAMEQTAIISEKLLPSVTPQAEGRRVEEID